MIQKYWATARHWNGQSFQNTPTFVSLAVDAQSRWSYEFPKTAGRYQVFAAAIDNVGSVDPTPATANVVLRK